MGTRAYRERERERRELEKEMNREAMSRIVVGNVRAEFGLPGAGREEGVVVKTSLERREEAASGSGN